MTIRVVSYALLMIVALPVTARAQDRYCDPALENCYRLLLDTINAEMQGVDVAIYYIRDKNVVNALQNARTRGAYVRIILDTKGESKGQDVIDANTMIRNFGIPTIRPASVYFHSKSILFHGQNIFMNGSANGERQSYQGYWQYLTQYPRLTNYRNEQIDFNRNTLIVNAARRMFDDWWINTTTFVNYAGTVVRQRRYPLHAYDSRVMTHNAFLTALKGAINAEPQQIDANCLRFEDNTVADALIAAHRRGVVVRVDTEQSEFTTRPAHKQNLDRMKAAGIPIRIRNHIGNNHAKFVIFHGQRRVASGSSNFSPGTNVEWNVLTGADPAKVAYYSTRFNRRWTNAEGAVETKPY